MLQVIAHVVGLVVLCNEFSLSIHQIHSLSDLYGNSCRDSHCENGLVRCCLYRDSSGS